MRPAHVGQRRHFDHVALDQLTHPVETQHLEQGVIQRPQVGIDLLRQIAGQEPEPLAGLHRRPHQHQPADPLFLQRLHGRCNGKIGLAGAGGADTEIEVVVADIAQVALLIHAAAFHLDPAGADDDLVGGPFRAFQLGFHAGILEVEMHLIGTQLLGPAGVVEVLEHHRGGFHGGGFPDHPESMGTIADLDAETAFDLAEVFVELTAEVGETLIVSGLEGEVCGVRMALQNNVGLVDVMRMRRLHWESVENTNRSSASAADSSCLRQAPYAHHLASQGIRQGLCNTDIHEVANQTRMPGEVHDPVILRAPGNLRGHPSWRRCRPERAGRSRPCSRLSGARWR